MPPGDKKELKQVTGLLKQGGRKPGGLTSAA